MSTLEENYVEGEPSSADHYDPYPEEWMASLPHDVVEAQDTGSALQLDIEVAVDVVAVADDNSPVTPSPSSAISPLSFGIKSDIVNLEPNRIHNDSSKHRPRHFHDTHSEHDGSESGHNSEDSHRLLDFLQRLVCAASGVSVHAHPTAVHPGAEAGVAHA